MVENIDPCKKCIYHGLAEKKLLDKSVSFWCYKYNKLYNYCPDVTLEKSLNKAKNILQNWTKFLERSEIMQAKTCKECGYSGFFYGDLCPTCFYKKQNNKNDDRNDGFSYAFNNAWAKGGMLGTSKKPLLSGRPDRDEVINDDDILNVRIFAETFK